MIGLAVVLLDKTFGLKNPHEVRSDHKVANQAGDIRSMERFTSRLGVLFMHAR